MQFRSELPPRPSDGFVADPTDADFVRAARWALENGNSRLALEQASAAAALRPDHEPYVKLLDEAIASARGPLELLKLPETGAFYGLCAARGRALARFDRFQEALECLYAATTFRPETPFLDWAVAWIAPARAAKRVKTRPLAAMLLRLADASWAHSLDSGLIRNLEASLSIAERVQVHHDFDVNLLVARSRTLRALDRWQDAQALLAREGSETTWEIAVEQATIEKDHGTPEGRRAWLERALVARPQDVSALLDLGEAELESGNLEASLARFESAASADHSSPLAANMVAYVGALAARQATLGAATRRDDDQSRPLLEADLEAYVTRLPDPVDPLIGAIRSAQAGATAEKAPPRLVVRVRAERPLAPSAAAAFRLAMKTAGKEGDLHVDHPPAEARVGELWSSGNDPVPRVDPPSAEILERIGALARTPFDWGRWCQAASQSEALDTDPPASLDGCVNAMAYPPAPPSGEWDVAQWVHAFQTAAAISIAFARAPASLREDALTKLLASIDDWVGAAALLGLRALWQTEPELRSHALPRLTELLGQLGTPLPPLALALAVVGGEVGDESSRGPFIGLRTRVRRERRELGGGSSP